MGTQKFTHVATCIKAHQALGDSANTCKIAGQKKYFQKMLQCQRFCMSVIDSVKRPCHIGRNAYQYAIDRKANLFASESFEEVSPLSLILDFLKKID